MLDAGWAAPTALGVLVFGLLLMYWLLRDRTPMEALQAEVKALRSSLSAQAERHARAIGALNAKVDFITQQYDEQRSRAHRAINDLARCVMALQLVQRLSTECTCDVLGPLPEIIDGLVGELETLTNRRHDDPPAATEGTTP